MHASVYLSFYYQKINMSPYLYACLYCLVYTLLYIYTLCVYNVIY